MKRTVGDCPHRAPLPQDGDDGPGAFACALAQRVLGGPPLEHFRVGLETCESCCEHRAPSPAHLNPVVASLVYRGATAVLKSPGAGWRARQEAVRAQRYVVDQIELADVRAFGPSTMLVPMVEDEVVASGEVDVAEDDDCVGAGRPAPRHRLALATGLLTAPRDGPTIGRALRDLMRAGFDGLQIFAEPGSWVPGRFIDLPRTVHGRRLGERGNLHAALVSLLAAEPGADGFVIFPDDVEALEPGLRAWCDRELWPLGAGLAVVSAGVCGADGKERGWRLLDAERPVPLIAPVLMFRRDTVREVLADAPLLGPEHAPGGTAAAALLEWAARRGRPVAHHRMPVFDTTERDAANALVEDGTDTIDRGGTEAPPAVREVDVPRPSRRPSLGRIGLVGWNVSCGLGYLNRDLATHFPIAKWLIPRYRALPILDPPPVAAKLDFCQTDATAERVRAWLRGLDWLLFAERPCMPELLWHARDLGVPVACVPMWEFADVGSNWIRQCDLMICPTRFTYEMHLEWKRRFAFDWEVAYVPWPIDVDRFPFRQRERCECFVFVNGNGGGQAVREDGRWTSYHRKGLDLILAAARTLRAARFRIYSQIPVQLPDWSNLEVRRPPDCPADLYEDGDVCVQPSRWEGIGLGLLECQAAGLPLVTTDAPPMNEFRPLRAVPARYPEIVTLEGRHAFTSHDVLPEDLTAALVGLYRTDIREASRAARAFIESEHSWKRAAPLLVEALSR